MQVTTAGGDHRLGTGRPRWPSVAMMLGGAQMIALWPIFTTHHGPTSFDEGGELLGRDPEFWGAMMEGPSLLLMAAGLYGTRLLLTLHAAPRARVGLVLALIGLVVPAIANLAILAVWPPLLAGLLGVGLILIALGQRDGTPVAGPVRAVLIGMGVTQIYAFFWFVVVRPDVLDRIDGYRIYGLVANVIFGLGWMLLGALVLAQARRDDRAAAPITDVLRIE